MKYSEGKEILEIFALVTTIAASLIAVISLPIIMQTLALTKIQTESDIETTKRLADLIESSQNQTEALTMTVKEIQHQTIVNAYTNGVPLDVKWRVCDESERRDADQNYLGRFLVQYPIMVDKSGTQTIVPARAYFEFWTWGTSENLDYRYEKMYAEQYGTYVINPADPQQFPDLDLSNLFGIANKTGYTEIKIDAYYSFTPFSPFKKDGDLGIQSDEKMKPLAKFKLTNGQWEMQDISELVCR